MRLRELTASPSFVVYLIAVALVPIRWLSPVGSLYEHGEWSDLLVGVAGLLWLAEKRSWGDLRLGLRRWQLPLALYLLLGCASAAVALPDLGGSWKTVLLMIELAVLAALSADYARRPQRRRAIAWVIVASALVTVALGALGLVLFYAGVHTGLIGSYGEQYVPSHLYARVQSGMESPPLLASYCIFASGIVAGEDAALPARLRLGSQVALGLLCAATFSRGLIGFLLALVIRRSRAIQGRGRVLIPVGAALLSLAIIGALTAGRLHLNPTRPSSISYTVPDPGNRREAFVTSLRTFEHHPVLGIGPGALPGVNSGVPFRAHFTPLNVAATLGLPALCALIAMLWLIWRDRRRPTDVALWSAAAGLLLDGLAQDIDHFRHVWVLIGLLGSPRGSPAHGKPT